MNESRAILAEMQLGSLEKTLAPYRIFFQNSNPRNFETLEPLQSNRPSSNKPGLGGLGRKRENLTSSEEKKKRWCPSGAGFGVWPTWLGGDDCPGAPPSVCCGPGRGGTIISTLGSTFLVPNSLYL